MTSFSRSIYPALWASNVEGVCASTASTPFFLSSAKYGCSFAQTAFVRCDGSARKSSFPVYGVTLRTMKSRTLIEVSQSPGRKSFQQSPVSASFLRAALAFMVRLLGIRSVFVAGDRSRTAVLRARDDLIIVALALRHLIYVKLRRRLSRFAPLSPGPSRTLSERRFGYASHFGQCSRTGDFPEASCWAGAERLSH